MSNIEEKKAYPIDMSDKEISKLEQYIADGLPFIAEMTHEKVRAAVELYLNGSSYRDISLRLGVKKNAIMYIAYKHGFYEMKMEMLTDLMSSIKSKVEMVNLKSLDFMTEVAFSLESYYRDIFEKYRLTKNPKIIESADLENMKTYFKVIENLQKISSKKEGDSMLGLNLPEGATIKKIDDNTLEITPNNNEKMVENKVGEILKTLSELKRSSKK